MGVLMNKVLMRSLFVAGLAGSLWPMALSAPPAPPDPWTKAPPLPTTCYVESDSFPDKFRAAIESVKVDMERQQQLNEELKNRVGQLDPMEQAKRMQDYLMAHPEEGMKLMQQNAAVGDLSSPARVQYEENRKSLDNELTELLSRYNTALDGALEPIKAKFKDLDVRAQKDLVAVGETYTYAPWAVKEFNALSALSNKTYGTICGNWWVATGPFHGWMKKYKDHLIKDEVPIMEEGDNVGAGFMVVIAGTPESPFKSTATFRAALDYIKRTENLFAKREVRPVADFEGK